MQKTTAQLDLGGCIINWLEGGTNKLDGGAMFGAVPKVLWSKRCSVDKENGMELRNSPLLVRHRDTNVIIETGLGNKLTEKQLGMFQVQQPSMLLEDLKEYDLDRFDIDYVILTHGDFDHAGGAVFINDSGELEATFPNAQYIIQQKEWDDICNPIDRTKHTYFAQNFEQVSKNDQLVFANGEMQVTPGVKVYHSGGHTRGHQIVEITGEHSRAVHLGDLLPTHHHINPLWIMAYDNFPLEVIERKKEFLSRYQKEECWFTFYHDKEMRAFQLDKDDKRFSIVNTVV